MWIHTADNEIIRIDIRDSHFKPIHTIPKSMITTMVVKECVNRALETSLQEGLLFERRVFHSLFSTEDQKEGMNAFMEKREAQFRDK